MKQFVANNVKNLIGWRTNRKLIIFSVDDYGNVRLDSKKARETMDSGGLKIHSRFDVYDALETLEDLEKLYEVLSSVKDKNGKPAIFTPYVLPCNINFECMAEENYASYRYELLPETYAKLAARDPHAYEGAWELWKEGIANGLMAPQFHGREHLNVKVLEEKLAQRDHEVLTALKNRSYTSISSTGYPTIGYTAAFAFAELKDIEAFPNILKEGVAAFETVYGCAATTFTPPAQQFPRQLEGKLNGLGLIHLDKPFYRARHLGGGKYKREASLAGKNQQTGGATLVRNVVFEPAHDRGVDWVAYAFKQIETAFFWKRPAVISSHRVNFCGHIDPDNRKTGIDALKRLLKKVVRRWPEVEFMAAGELGDLIAKVNKTSDIQ